MSASGMICRVYQDVIKKEWKVVSSNDNREAIQFKKPCASSVRLLLVSPFNPINM